MMSSTDHSVKPCRPTLCTCQRHAVLCRSQELGAPAVQRSCKRSLRSSATCWHPLEASERSWCRCSGSDGKHPTAPIDTHSLHCKWSRRRWCAIRRGTHRVPAATGAPSTWVKTEDFFARTERRCNDCVASSIREECDSHNRPRSNGAWQSLQGHWICYDRRIAVRNTLTLFPSEAMAVEQGQIFKLAIRTARHVATDADGTISMLISRKPGVTPNGGPIF